MPLSIIVRGPTDDQAGYRVDVDIEDGQTRVWMRGHLMAEAWYCPPGAWEHVQPDDAAIRSALDQAGAVLVELDIVPDATHPDCADDSQCEAAG